MIKIRKKSKTEFEKFKELLLDMHRGYPNWIYDAEGVKKLISDFQLSDLTKNNYLVKISRVHQGKTKEYYMLGPNALTLVSSWKNERLSNTMENFTYTIVVFTVLIFATSLYQVFTPMNPLFPFENLILSLAAAAAAMIIVILCRFIFKIQPQF